MSIFADFQKKVSSRRGIGLNL